MWLMCGVKGQNVVILQAAISIEQSRLQVRLDDELVDVKWGIRSPLMAERYPESPNCESARFLVEFAVPDVITEMAFELVDDGTGVISPIFKLQTDVATYDRKFYAQQQEGSLRSAQIYFSHLLEYIKPISTVDFGCGAGTWLTALAEQGVADIMGLDGCWVNGIDKASDRFRFMAVDLNNPPLLDKHYDLALSLEVAEHLDPASSERFIDAITHASDTVLFGAAYIRQPGENHVNCRKHSYWAGLFLDRGYDVFDLFRPVFWGDKQVEPWYRQNTFLYIKKNSPNFLKLKDAGIQPMIDIQFMNCIHPWLYGNNK